MDDCILWGSRVLIPEPGLQDVLQELHGGHPGVSRMKNGSDVCMFVWWPHMDKDIERVVQHYNQCQQVKPAPPAAPLQPWQWPS